jgi:hypothetical protein
MADWTVFDGPGKAESGKWSSSEGTTITSHASANTDGAFVEFFASTEQIAKYIVIYPSYITDNRHFLVDIAVGAAGYEVVVIPDLYFSNVSDGRVLTTIGIPTSIPSGSRISARCKCSTGNSTCVMALQLFSAGFLTQGISGVVTAYGAGIGGTPVDPGGTINVKGAWTEISSSINSTRLLFAAFGGMLHTPRDWAAWRVDIGVGSAGNEVVIIPDIHLLSTSNINEIFPTHSIVFPFCVPAGTRVSVRAQCGNNNADDRKFDVILYGIS